MRSKCFTNKNGTPTGITRDWPIVISVITVIIYNSNKFDEDDDNNYEGKFS